MNLPRLPLAAAALVLAACNGTPSSTSPSADPSGKPKTTSSAIPSSKPDTTTPDASTGVHFTVNGTGDKNANKATITSFSRGALAVNFGIAALTPPDKNLLTIEIELKDYVGDQPHYDTTNVTQAVAKLGVGGTASKEGAKWTPEAPNGITFELSVTDRKVTCKWVGKVKASQNNQEYDVDALMTDVAVPFK